MTSESLTWKLEQDMCRCCHSEGSFPNLSDPCNYLGQQEIYSDMLSDCFDVHISPVPGPLCTVTYTICQGCVMQLRAACNFKKQVLYCEERFQEMYSKNFINVSDSNPAIKVEVQEIFQDDCSDEYIDSLACASDEHAAYTMTVDDDRSKRKKVKPRSKRTKVQKTICKTKKNKQLSPPRDDASAPAQTAVTKKKGGRKFCLNEGDFSKDGNIYKCARCDKSYDKVDSLRFHVKIKHYKIPCYSCPYCPKEFMTPAPLTVHKLEAHQIDDRFKCNACKGTFNTKLQLRKHTNNFHMLGEKYKCEFCDYESFSFEGMYKHKIKHKTVKDYHCRFCKKSFLRKTTLDLHERIHTGDRRKVCNECGQAFVQKASLNYHMAKYHPEVNY